MKQFKSDPRVTHGMLKPEERLAAAAKQLIAKHGSVPAVELRVPEEADLCLVRKFILHEFRRLYRDPEFVAVLKYTAPVMVAQNTETRTEYFLTGSGAAKRPMKMKGAPKHCVEAWSEQMEPISMAELLMNIDELDLKRRFSRIVLDLIDERAKEVLAEKK